MSGYFELRSEEQSCLVRIDYYYGRGINQFLLFFPIDEYDDSFLSNDRMESESITGIQTAAGLK
jgi:hypothetical protein